jgi:RNA polymerase sigma-70 factor (ECF subfamily)
MSCIKPFIQQMRPAYKEALEYTEFGNHSQKELAEKMNISYSGAKSTVQRARRQLRKIFDQCCEIETDKYGAIHSVKPNSDCSCG